MNSARALATFFCGLVIALLTLIGLGENGVAPTREQLFAGVFQRPPVPAWTSRTIGTLLAAEVRRARHGIWGDLPDQRATVGTLALSAVEQLQSAPPPDDLSALLDETMLAMGLIDWMESDPAAPGARVLQSLPPFLVRLGVFAPTLHQSGGGTPIDQTATLALAAGQLMRMAKYDTESPLRTLAASMLAALPAKLQAAPVDAGPTADTWYLRDGMLLLTGTKEFSRSPAVIRRTVEVTTELLTGQLSHQCHQPDLPSFGEAAKWYVAIRCEIDGQTPLPKSATALSSDLTSRTKVIQNGRLPLGNALLASDHVVLWSSGDASSDVQIFRSLPVNQLLISAARHPEDAVAVSHSPNSPAEFRAAAIHRGDLYLVYYDNPSLTNYLQGVRKQGDRYEFLGEPIALPSLEDPAGRTYEMIPQIQLFSVGETLHIIGGTLSATLRPDGSLAIERLDNCSRAVEAVASPQGPVVLCIQAEESGPSAPFSLQGPEGIPLPELGTAIPYNLRFANGQVATSAVQSRTDFAEMLRFDIERLNSGVLEFGIDNVEGRIPWSQIYYINGFLDFLGLSQQGADRWSAFAPLLTEMRFRLDMEMRLLDQQWPEGNFKTRAFSVDRSPQLFAVQTSRLLLLFKRYQDELADPLPLASLPSLITAVTTLDDHIDQLQTEGEEAWWLPPGEPYLAWPKGSAFYFDGLNVPYNHQNEWAYALLRAGGPTLRDTAMGILRHFLRRTAPDGMLPLSGTWDYWWGRAYDGWTVEHGFSINTPAYGGDHGAAWISFRSIDTMSMLAAAPHLPPQVAQALVASAASLVEGGKVYPFAAYELHRLGFKARPNPEIARRYVRVSSPWELQNAAWAIDALLTLQEY